MSGNGELIPANLGDQQLIVDRSAGTSYQHTMEQVLRAFLAPLAESSREKVQMCLGRAALALGFGDRPLHEVPWHKVNSAVILELVARWRSELKKPTMDLYIYAVRGMARACFLHDLMSSEQYDKLKEIRLPSYGEDEGRGQYVKPAWLDKLTKSCEADERTILGLRDHAMLALLFGSGLRRNEAVNLAREDLDLDGMRFKVVVKGGKKAMRYLSPWAVEPLREWIEEIDRQAQLAKDQPPIQGKPSRRNKPKRAVREGGLLLRRLSKSGTILGDLVGNGLYDALKERCIVAGVTFIRPHDARRTLATNIIRERGINYAQKALGHKDISTTKRYDMTDDDEMSDMFKGFTR
jgi:integrase